MTQSLECIWEGFSKEVHSTCTVPNAWWVGIGLWHAGTTQLFQKKTEENTLFHKTCVHWTLTLHMYSDTDDQWTTTTINKPIYTLNTTFSQ